MYQVVNPPAVSRSYCEMVAAAEPSINLAPKISPLHGMSRWRLFSRHSLLSMQQHHRAIVSPRKCEYLKEISRSSDHSVGLKRGGMLSQQREQRQRAEISQRKSTLQIGRRIGVEVVKRTSQRSISPVGDWTGFCRTEPPSPSPSPSKHFPLLYIYLSDTRHNSLKVRGGGLAG